MSIRHMRTIAVAALGMAVLAACVPVRDTRYNDPYYDPYRNSGYHSGVYADGYYRASDGRVFATRADRDYYQRQLNQAYFARQQARRDARRAERRDRILAEEAARRAALEEQERQRRRADREDPVGRRSATAPAVHREPLCR